MTFQDDILNAGKIGHFGPNPCSEIPKMKTIEDLRKELIDEDPNPRMTMKDLMDLREFVDKKLIKTTDHQWKTTKVDFPVVDPPFVKYSQFDVDSIKEFWENYQQRPGLTPEEENRMLRENCQRYERRIETLEIEVTTKTGQINRHVLLTHEQAAATRELVAVCQLLAQGGTVAMEDLQELVAKVESRLNTDQTVISTVEKLRTILEATAQED